MGSAEARSEMRGGRLQPDITDRKRYAIMHPTSHWPQWLAAGDSRIDQERTTVGERTNYLWTVWLVPWLYSRMEGIRSRVGHSRHFVTSYDWTLLNALSQTATADCHNIRLLETRHNAAAEAGVHAYWSSAAVWANGRITACIAWRSSRRARCWVRSIEFWRRPRWLIPDDVSTVRGIWNALAAILVRAMAGHDMPYDMSRRCSRTSRV